MTKNAIAMNLDRLKELAQEYIVAMGGDGDNDIAERLTLSSFISWLKQQQEETTIFCSVCRTVHRFKAGECPAMMTIQ